MRNFLTLMALMVTTFSFSQAPDYPAGPQPRTIIKAEYFFDIDPGKGNGTSINFAPSFDLNNFFTTINLNGSALSNGFHRLYLRTQDDSGKWSLTQSYFFDNVVVPAYPDAPGSSADIVEAEYFFDVDPGLGLGKKIIVPPANEAENFNAIINLLDVSPGAHRIYIRSKDASGKWSMTNFSVFDNSSQIPYPEAPSQAPLLTEAEYYFDTDPGFGNGNPITLPVSNDVSNFSLNVPIGSLSPGNHTIYLRSKQNPWSLTAYAEFTIASILPVSWVYVKAEILDADARISWATGFEENADKFIIEYSKDGVNFHYAGEVAASNSGTGSSYSFLHTKPGSGAIYYRIKQLDNDGNFMYSKTLLLLFRDNLKAPVIFPNPTASVIHFSFPSNYSAKTIEIYDLAGKLVQKELVNNQQIISFSVAGLKPGLYTARIIAANQTNTISFVKN